ncbi:uncharacterized protein LOC108912272 [Anoplophora glabripennis]|uniref:uncharacterized protein LOC108912272 n=1 Tax=Anoplophora glabripennis TaxID=217634 RepID=UPI00087592D3|nr:uncharacterized protein LOC108912272 [Anoplophora glabripennis]
MSLKTVFLLVCSLVAVNSFVYPEPGRKSRSDGSLFPLSGYEVNSRRNSESHSNEQGQFGRSQIENEEEPILGRQSGTQSNRGQDYDERRERMRGQKLMIKYPASSSSSSSEEDFSDSHEIRKVEKQYHDTNGYNGGNNRYEPAQTQQRSYKMNFEAPDLQNAIDKDM